MGICYSPGDNNEKTPLFCYLRLRFEHGRHGGAANRGEDKSHTIPVGTDIYVCLPYTLTVKKKKKKKEQKKRRKKKETDDKKKKKSNKTKQREKILMSRLLANQNLPTILDIL